jgi:hypothetical protein
LVSETFKHFGMRILFVLAFGLAGALQSCYSVRISSGCTPAPSTSISQRTDFYRDLDVQVLDTVIKMPLLTNQIDLRNVCDQGEFAVVEYRNTFGNILRLFFTFGRHRKVKIYYVCCKTQ